jgi:hypothetical protein
VWLTIWVYVDAKAIGSDRGQSPQMVNTHPRLWATGVFLFLILLLPLYLLARVRYKRLLAQRRALISAPDFAGSEDVPGVWPPPPQMPAA